VFTVLGFVICIVFVFMLQMEQKWQLRLFIAGVMIAGMYTGGLDGWLYNVPLFVWAGLLLSNVAQVLF
jgi:hypothetical protein